MKPRRLAAILEMPYSRRLDIIAEGLELLAINVRRLAADAKYLEDLDRPRGAKVIGTFAIEEAAKVLILLDLVRLDDNDHAGQSKQVKRFYQHLARCLYATAYSGSPASLGEVRVRVDQARRSHYLDGPNDVDWIFRNEVLAEREDALYVDLVDGEDGLMWSSPSTDGEIAFLSPRLPTLVASLRATGITSRQGLSAVRDVWSGASLLDDPRWGDLAALNHRVLNRAWELELPSADVTQDDVNAVYNYWIFPLTSLDMSEVKVDIVELQTTRQAVLDGIALDYFW
ncbi:AbiV family abortive infection protein [Actinoplanes sp. NPDC020271]|uniref:AbiV family abortive infection protein n=1 Tax=Actinoplanes sp. NPDC020271 TaxID=3363896 RepID=UPI0037B0030B